MYRRKLNQTEAPTLPDSSNWLSMCVDMSTFFFSGKYNIFIFLACYIKIIINTCLLEWITISVYISKHLQCASLPPRWGKEVFLLFQLRLDSLVLVGVTEDKNKAKEQEKERLWHQRAGGEEEEEETVEPRLINRKKNKWRHPRREETEKHAGRFRRTLLDRGETGRSEREKRQKSKLPQLLPWKLKRG